MIAVLAEPSNFHPAPMLAAPLSACPPELVSLLEGVTTGEQRALERFYRLTISRVFGLALRIVRCRATAEEVAEDVYVQIWHSAATYDPQRGSPLAWVLTICRSRALDSLRRADKAIVDPDPTERLDAIAKLAPGLQDLLQASQEHAALHAALARLIQEELDPIALSPCEREALLRRILERTGGEPPLAPAPPPKAS